MAVYDFRAVEKKVLDFWVKNKVPQQLTAFGQKGKKKFFLLDGPPYANGLPHVGHGKTITFKDLWAKFKRMQGYDVWFQPGFDCHGLPIENKIEKELGVSSKQDIEEKVGVEKFTASCRKFATKNLREWMDTYRRMGDWRGWLDPYLSYDNEYIESGWWTIKRLYEKGMMVEGEKPIFWCPHCQTTISGYEATDSYKDVTDTAVFIKFPLRGRPDEYMLAWTTTAWTLPANTALMVHPDERYVKVEYKGEFLYMAEKLLKTVMEKVGAEKYVVVEKLKGSDMEGWTYDPLLNIPIQRGVAREKSGHKVVMSIPILKKVVASKVREKKGMTSEMSEEEKFGHMVTMDTGTGVVHIAPGHGAEDNKAGEHYKLPVLSPVDDQGRLTEGTGFEGVFVKAADHDIVDLLEATDRLFHSEQITHSYPLCWRCKSHLIFRLSRQWFFTIDSVKDELLRANEKVNWLPGHAKKRMHNWIEDAVDWCVSIQRYWGIPIPLWKCADCGSYKMVGSTAELKKEMTNNVKLDDIHKHVVDKVKLRCRCKGEMSRIPDIINIWVESGIAPWASLGYPYQNRELFDKLWSVDLVDESQDQIRGWFYSLLFMGIAVFDKKTCSTICLNGWTLDAKGEAMSKSVGNVILAEESLRELGGDVSRLYNCYNIAPWETQKFSLDGAKELLRFMNTLQNALNFAKMYGLDTRVLKKKAKLSVEDRWMLSRLHTTIGEVTDDAENFRFHYYGRKLVDLVQNDFSRWYMKLAKERISLSKDDEGARYTILEFLRTMIKLLAPVCPFITEHIYQELFSRVEKEKSVHMTSWPKPDGRLVDKKLERQMAVVDRVVEAVHALRQEQGIRLRWPIAKATVVGGADARSAVKDLNEMLKSMCNAKKVDVGRIALKIEARPDCSVIGPKFGREMNKVAELILRAKPEDLKKKLEKGKTKLGKYEVDSTMVRIVESVPEGVTGKTFDGGAVYIDTKMSKELKEEALVRELVRSVQKARKEAGRKVSETIKLSLKGDKAVLGKWKPEIEKETSSKVSIGTLKGKKGHVMFDKQKIEFAF